MSDDLHNAVEALAKAGELLNIVAKGAIENLAWDDALDLLHTIRTTLTEHVNPIDASLTRHIYLTGPHGDVEVDGIGVVGIRRNNDRKSWDERSALFAMLDSRMAARGGEQPDPAEVIEWVLEVAGIQYLRVNALKAVGLRADDYCETTPGKVAVSLPKT